MLEGLTLGGNLILFVEPIVIFEHYGAKKSGESILALLLGLVHSLMGRFAAIDPAVAGLGVFLPGPPGVLGGKGVFPGLP